MINIILQLGTEYNYESIFSPIVSTFLIIFLMVAMVYLYRYQRFFLLIFIVWIFSIVIGLISIKNFWLPFSPYFQIFFMLIQSVYLFLTSINLFEEFRGMEN